MADTAQARDDITDNFDNIRIVTLACRLSLQACLSLASLNADQWAENRLADFNLWDAGIGASSTSRASLEDRLATHPHLLLVIMNLLNVFHKSIELCQSIGYSQPRGDNVSDGTTTYQTDPLPAKNVGVNIENTEELADAKSVTDLVLNDLVRMATAIRTSATSSRQQKADRSFDPDDDRHSGPRSHLQLIVSVRASTLELQRQTFWSTPASESESEDVATENQTREWSQKMQSSALDMNTRDLTVVQQRLVMANIRRHHRIIYSHTHGQRIFRPPLALQISRLQEHVVQPVSPTAAEASFRTATASVGKSRATTKPSDTTASIVESKVFFELAERPTPSQQAVTVISKTGSRLSYPYPPEIKPTAQVFKCPCCSITLPRSFIEPRRWRKHIKETIVPYTCVLEDCPAPSNLYAEKEAWRQHMLDEHSGRAYWECLLCDNGASYPSASRLAVHIGQSHTADIPAADIPGLLDVSRRTKSPAITQCPLCTVADTSAALDSNHVLLDHIAEHIHDFALRSLPWPPAAVGESQKRMNTSAEKVNEWFSKSHPDVKGTDYKPNLRTDQMKHAAKRHFTDNEYFLTHGYFRESSQASSLALTHARVKSDRDDYEDSGSSDGNDDDNVHSRRYLDMESDWSHGAEDESDARGLESERQALFNNLPEKPETPHDLDEEVSSTETSDAFTSHDPPDRHSNRKRNKVPLRSPTIGPESSKTGAPEPANSRGGIDIQGKFIETLNAGPMKSEKGKSRGSWEPQTLFVGSIGMPVLLLSPTGAEDDNMHPSTDNTVKASLRLVDSATQTEIQTHIPEHPTALMFHPKLPEVGQKEVEELNPRPSRRERRGAFWPPIAEKMRDRREARVRGTWISDSSTEVEELTPRLIKRGDAPGAHKVREWRLLEKRLGDERETASGRSTLIPTRSGDMIPEDLGPGHSFAVPLSDDFVNTENRSDRDYLDMGAPNTTWHQKSPLDLLSPADRPERAKPSLVPRWELGDQVALRSKDGSTSGMYQVIDIHPPDILEDGWRYDLRARDGSQVPGRHEDMLTHPRRLSR